MTDRPDPIPVGTRVRHLGERYPDALSRGTGTVVDVLRYHHVDRSYEYLVQCDKPLPWSNGETLVERNHMVPVTVVVFPGEEPVE